MIQPAGPRARAALGFLAGGIGALGIAPFGFWHATLIFLAVAFLLFERATTGRQALATGWACGTGYFSVALLWIIEPFLVEPEIFGWMAPFALIFMAAGLAIFWAGAFRLAFRATRMRLPALVVALALAELARAYVLTGFPWAGLAQIWVGVGPDLMLSVIGPHGLGLVTLGAGLALALAAGARHALMVRLAGPLAVVAFVGLGLWLQARLPETEFRAATIRLVQPNAPQDQKWDPAMMPVFLNRNLEYSAALPRPDLIVWPETSVPTLMEYGGPIFEDMITLSGGVPIVAGIQRRDDRRMYNSAFLLDGPVPSQVYDKHKLVPFGEYIPLGDLAARFGLHGFAAREGQGFSAGPGVQLMDLGALGQALPLICYEAVFPDLARSTPRPDMLIQITNDAWFGERSGPYQHLAQARMRAIEQGLAMIRVANTGISAMIDPYGRLIAQIPLGQAGYVDAALPEPRPVTLYARSGDWPALILLLLLAAAIVARNVQRQATLK